MGRARIALLAACATAAALVATAVPAPARHGSTGLYSVSLVGFQRSVVTRSAAATDDQGCAIRRADRDLRTITFASKRRMNLTIGSSGLPLVRFDLAARVSGSYHRQTRLVDTGASCSAPVDTTRSCGPARLHARLALRPTGTLRVRFGGGFVRPADRPRCATTLTQPDAFLVPSEGRLRQSPAGAARVLLHGHLVLRTGVAGGIEKASTVDWKLVLTRVG